MTATLTEQDQVGWGLSEITEAAALALRLELDCHPKPGLVTPRSMGSHGDMDHACMAQGIAAIAPFFQALALAGRDGAGFADLKPIGLAAEQGMMTATGGVNTHRGAIFSLGLLVAATAGLAAAARSRYTAACSWLGLGLGSGLGLGLGLGVGLGPGSGSG